MKNEAFDEVDTLKHQCLLKFFQLHNSEVCKDVRMSPSCYYRTLKGKLMI